MNGVSDLLPALRQLVGSF